MKVVEKTRTHFRFTTFFPE